MRPPSSISVKLAIPLMGEVSGTWTPNDAERTAAWEMYVELVTRVSVIPLEAEEGILRESLSSYYSLFGTTRHILRTHGPEVAHLRSDSSLSFAYIAVAILNGTLRPLLTRWHPELLAYEELRPTSRSATAWERAWNLAPELRGSIEDVRVSLTKYADSRPRPEFHHCTSSRRGCPLSLHCRRLATADHRHPRRFHSESLRVRAGSGLPCSRSTTP